MQARQGWEQQGNPYSNKWINIRGWKFRRPFLCSDLMNIRLQALQWRHNGCDSVPYHQPHHCLLNRLFGRSSKKTSKLRVTGLGLCEGNSPVTGEFPAQRPSNAENVSIWWRHHVVASWHNMLSVDIICSGNGLSSNWHQAITWPNDPKVTTGMDTWFLPWNITEYLVFQMSESYPHFNELKP